MSNFGRVSAFFINFVHGNNDRNTRRLRVVERFDCLGHHTIIRCDYQYSDICDFGTTSAHCGKRFVTWGINKSNCSLYTIMFAMNLVGTDMLSNSPSFTFGDITFTERIK